MEARFVALGFLLNTDDVAIELPKKTRKGKFFEAAGEVRAHY